MFHRAQIYWRLTKEAELERGNQETVPELAVRVAQAFQATGQWPLYDELEVQYRKTMPLEALLSSAVPEWVRVQDIGNEERLILSSLEVYARLPETEHDVHNYLAAVRLFANVFLSDGKDGNVDCSTLRNELDLDGLELARLCQMIHRWGNNLTAGVTHGREFEEWTFRVNSRAMYFEDVQTLENYRDAERRIEEIWKLRSGRSTMVFQPDRSLSAQAFPPVMVPALQGVELKYHPAISGTAATLLALNRGDQAVRTAMERFESYVQDTIENFDDVGVELFGRAFGGDQPRLPINGLASRRERDEQAGVLYLAKGAYAAFRNPVSHGRTQHLDTTEALERLAVVSMLFRYVEQARHSMRADEEPGA